MNNQKYSMALKKEAAQNTKNNSEPLPIKEVKREIKPEVKIEPTVIRTEPVPPAVIIPEPISIPKTIGEKLNPKLWDFQTISTVALILFLGVIVVLFSLLKGNISEKNALKEKLGGIETVLNNNNQQINSIYADAKALDSKMTNISTNIGKINETYDAQTKALVNLSREKNALNHRLSVLEIEQQKLKPEK